MPLTPVSESEHCSGPDIVNAGIHYIPENTKYEFIVVTTNANRNFRHGASARWIARRNRAEQMHSMNVLSGGALSAQFTAAAVSCDCRSRSRVQSPAPERPL
jgi:hypothetical protein